jgi:hypothetical protein
MVVSTVLRPPWPSRYEQAQGSIDFPLMALKDFLTKRSFRRLVHYEITAYKDATNVIR